MKTFVVLLRGINVSGQRKIQMAKLRVLLADLGFKSFSTYIQSGNIVLKSELDKAHIQNLIEGGIKNSFGFEVPVLVMTIAEFEDIYSRCPYQGTIKASSYFLLMYRMPEMSLKEKILEINYPNESFFIDDYCIYLYCEAGYGRAKLNSNFFEKKLNVQTTARNYKTMTKLLSLSLEL